jgi:hypothetical protein
MKNMLTLITMVEAPPDVKMKKKVPSTKEMILLKD